MVPRDIRAQVNNSPEAMLGCLKDTSKKAGSLTKGSLTSLKWITHNKADEVNPPELNMATPSNQDTLTSTRGGQIRGSRSTVHEQ